jgi:hypothetical protein
MSKRVREKAKKPEKSKCQKAYPNGKTKKEDQVKVKTK